MAIKLGASRDKETGEVYVPARALAADGSLRPCEQIEVNAQGILYSWTEYRDDFYGLVDLDCGARIQAYLEPGPHAIGARYVANARVERQGTPTVRFGRG